MALGQSKKKVFGKKTSAEKKDAKWATLIQVVESKEGRIYAKANNFKGQLLWLAFGGKDGNDRKNSTLYAIDSLNVINPHKDSPDFVKNVLTVNLLNEKAAREFDPNDLEDEEGEEEDAE